MAFLFCFNPSSNGNGAGILVKGFRTDGLCRFNPSSNGNGAGMHNIYCFLNLETCVSILLLMEMVLESDKMFTN